MIESDDFAARTAPYRRELLAHCYRMLGSIDDAEDLVQETLLRAWRAYGDFEGRASMRTWLYRIATNACLNALEHSSRRVLPTGLSGPTGDPTQEVHLAPEIPWLQPMPDALVASEASDPAAIVAARDDMRLALMAAWQHLPPRQRAVLILRDVLHWKATEVAELIGASVAAVNSMLQRAHAALGDLGPDTPVAEPADPEIRALLDKYAAAFEAADMDTLITLLRADAVWEMPPIAEWFRGNSAVVELIRSKCPYSAGEVRMVPIAANGQPGFAFYLRGHAQSLQILTATPAGIAHVVSYHDSALFAAFGLPTSLAETILPVLP
ncbi:sigma-70 family RNA polymerase sigma factor [Nocardia sp. NBC_00565]|uniref:sigma-70 family RNA polymerase sigma factor n=1 Tax=Nocardia sp. NBC_00565 TaxID=2975993 RepID=UPI002E81F3C7|nr:sigma-70 family RNA polymerase sigma factor [Nocardia sp. NBC_00565]WUC04449.1 sigma-70 family RNA polymerase sigma factor [Nocardia sp. NBC_00565]